MKKYIPKNITIIFLLIFVTFTISKNLLKKDNNDYQKSTSLIKESVENNPLFISSAYNKTAYLVDTFGPRLWGSQPLQDAVEYLKQELIKEGFQNVKLEPNPNSIHWVRGKESLTMLSPRKYATNIPMTGLGKSIGGNVTGELIIFQTFEEIEENKNKTTGKIVLFAPNWTNYEDVKKYRSDGPSIAAKYNATACLIRSLTPFSISTVHGGDLIYNNTYPKIPAAAITIEDSDMFERMLKRNQTVILNLQMEAKTLEPITTYNLVAEIKGTEFPNEIILIGGHIDSWDIGTQTGAMDNTAGFMVCIEAMRVLIKLNLKPRRTIRFIAWSGEEFEDITNGSYMYLKLHYKELEKHVIAFESDSGTTDIEGWGFSGGKSGFKVFENLNNKYLKKTLGLKKIVYNDGVQADTTPLYKLGIPVVRNIVKDTEDSRYYYTYHHSAGDTMNVLDAWDMDRNVMAIASMFYIIADTDEVISKNRE